MNMRANAKGWVSSEGNSYFEEQHNEGIESSGNAATAESLQIKSGVVNKHKKRGTQGRYGYHTPRYFQDRGETVCIQCGEVLEDHVMDMSLSTHQFKGVGHASGIRQRGYGKSARPKSRDLRRAFKLQKMEYEEKRVVQGVVVINQLGARFSLSDQILRHSKDLFERAMAKIRNCS